MPSRKTPDDQSLDLFARPVAKALPVDEEVRPSAPEKPQVYRVSDLVRAAGRTLEAKYGLVWVEGELSNLSAPRSGHLYFTLKDDDAQLPSVMFRSEAQRLKFRLSDGQVVRARGRLSIYEGQGKFQLYVDTLEPAGLGALQMAFEQLKQKLAAEGLFDRERKRALPRWPRRIGVVTSATGAAVRDIIRIAHRRGRARILIAPCEVQGDRAPHSIVAALRAIERQPEIDVVIVGRGGGSAEDLAAFNDEMVARAINSCRVPVVSAVGHEVDFTIADFVADVRAATPSQAAELVVPLHDEARDAIDQLSERLLHAGRRKIAEARQRIDQELERARGSLHMQLSRRRRALDEHARRLAALHPRTRLHRDRATLEGLRVRLDRRLRAILDERRRHFHGLVGKLDALSPLSVLQRGYSLTRTAEGHVVTDSSQVAPGSSVSVTLARGELDCRVQSVKKDSHDD